MYSTGCRHFFCLLPLPLVQPIWLGHGQSHLGSFLSCFDDTQLTSLTANLPSHLCLLACILGVVCDSSFPTRRLGLVVAYRSPHCAAQSPRLKRTSATDSVSQCTLFPMFICNSSSISLASVSTVVAVHSSYLLSAHLEALHCSSRFFFELRTWNLTGP